MMRFNKEAIKVIGFDADDTLWVNEPYYRETEAKFCQLLNGYASPEAINNRLYEIEMANMELYGYGTKAFVLSLIETAIDISGGKLPAQHISQIISMGKEQISVKNHLLPGVREVLEVLSGQYRLIVATKGDLLDQERKLKNSGIAGYFHHIEIMTGKSGHNYSKLLSHLDIQPHEFLMIGNSLKSDVLPVINLGGSAIHVPFEITWKHEEVDIEHIPANMFYTANSITGVLNVLGFPLNQKNN